MLKKKKNHKTRRIYGIDCHLLNLKKKRITKEKNVLQSNQFKTVINFRIFIEYI